MRKSFITSFFLVLLFATVSFAQTGSSQHIVKRGETFASIAAKYGISENELKAANPKVKTCYAGTKLVIAQKKSATEQKTTDTAKTAPAAKTTSTVDKTVIAEKDVPGAKTTPAVRTATAARTTARKKSHSAFFEGCLLYRNYEHHSAVVRKFSHGEAYNGERTMMVILKDNKTHIIDCGLHMHTIIDQAQNKAYIYSDVTRKGLVAPANEFIRNYKSAFDPDVELMPELRKESSMADAGRTQEYKGDKCRVYAGQMTTGENMLTDVELWYTDKYRINDSYDCLFAGLPVKGIVRKGIITQSGSIPLLGKMKSTLAIELVAVDEGVVDDSEVTPPTNISFTTFSKPAQMINLCKENTKTLKKQKLYPNTMKKEEVDYNIRSQWDFADEWLAKEFKGDNMGITWGKVGTQLFETLTSLSSAGGRHTEGVTSALMDIGTVVADIAGEEFSPQLIEGIFESTSSQAEPDIDAMADANGMIPISRLIAELESKVAPLREYRDMSESNQAKIEEIFSRPKQKVIEHGTIKERRSKRDLQEAQQYCYNTTKYSAAKFILYDFDRRIEYLRGLQTSGQEYISKETWNKFTGTRNNARKKYQQSQKDNCYDNAYRVFEDLVRDQYSDPSVTYDSDQVKYLQDQMKGYREMSGKGIKKSKWEDYGRRRR